MQEDLERKINDLKYQVEKIDGHTPHWNISNRVYGLCGLVITAMGFYATKFQEPLIDVLLIPFTIEMVGDIFTGKHHFISYRLLRVHPKYELDRLQSSKS